MARLVRGAATHRQPAAPRDHLWLSPKPEGDRRSCSPPDDAERVCQD